MSGVADTIKNIFNPPEIEVPSVSAPRLPDPKNPVAIAAQRRKQRERARRGRQGTIFSQGGAYSGTNLGGTA